MYRIVKMSNIKVSQGHITEKSFYASGRVGRTPCLFKISTKGNNFCEFQFASLNKEAIPKLGLLLKEQILSFKS